MTVIDAEEPVRRFLAARARSDFAAAAACAAPDVAWWSPVHGVQQGREALRDALADAVRDTDRFSSEVEGVETRADRIAVTVRNRGERRGEQLDSRQVLLFRVEDGRIAEVRIAVDDPEAVQAFWEA